MHHRTVISTPDLESHHSGSTPQIAGASTRLDLDGLTVDVDVIDEHVEITTGVPGRTTLGLALTRSEACRLAAALLDAAAPTAGGQR